MFNKLIVALLPLMPKKLVWVFSKRYIAGITIDSAIKVSRKLNQNGIMVTFDILGEFIKNLSEAQQNRDEYLNLIDTIERENLIGNYSVKPTMFGLLIDPDVCYNHIRDIVKQAAKYNNFIRIDMEDSGCTDNTIVLYRKLKTEFPANVGMVIQAYLKRTFTDVNNLLDIHTSNKPLNFRLCKGIYIEPAQISFKKHDDINASYIKNLEFMLQNNIYVGIATHDKQLVDSALNLIEKYNVNKNMYEFQMLYGVTPDLRQSIVDKGHRLRVYVPYGSHWFGYCTRRLKENPKMAQQIIKALFIRG